MKPMSGRQFARLVERHGWELLRINGSHHIYGKAGERARLSISVHGSAALKLGLLRALAKAAGVSEDLLS